MKSRGLTDADRAEVEALIARVEGELVAREEASRAAVPDLGIEITGVEAREPWAVEDPLVRLGARVEAVINGPAAKATPEALGRLLDELRALRRRFDIRSLDKVGGGDWLDEPPPAARVLLVDGRGQPFMRDGKVGLLVAPGATGKTFALVQLAAAVATGTRWLGSYGVTRKGRVVLALGEEDADEVRRRLWQTVKALDLDEGARADLRRNLYPLGLEGQAVALLHRTPDKNIGETEWFATFRDELARLGDLRCIILDPWSRWGGPDTETDAHAATLGVTLLERLTKLPGNPAVVVAHHERKRSKQDRGPSDASDTRGSSALVDGARFVANMRRLSRADEGEPPELLELRVTKANYTIAGPPLRLARGAGGVLRPATGAELDALDDAPPGQHRARTTRTPAAPPTPTGAPSLPSPAPNMNGKKAAWT